MTREKLEITARYRAGRAGNVYVSKEGNGVYLSETWTRRIYTRKQSPRGGCEGLGLRLE